MLVSPLGGGQLGSVLLVTRVWWQPRFWTRVKPSDSAPLGRVRTRVSNRLPGDAAGRGRVEAPGRLPARPRGSAGRSAEGAWGSRTRGSAEPPAVLLVRGWACRPRPPAGCRWCGVTGERLMVLGVCEVEGGPFTPLP